MAIPLATWADRHARERLPDGTPLERQQRALTGETIASQLPGLADAAVRGVRAQRDASQILGPAQESTRYLYMPLSADDDRIAVVIHAFEKAQRASAALVAAGRPAASAARAAAAYSHPKRAALPRSATVHHRLIRRRPDTGSPRIITTFNQALITNAFERQDRPCPPPLSILECRGWSAMNCRVWSWHRTPPNRDPDADAAGPPPLLCTPTLCDGLIMTRLGRMVCAATVSAVYAGVVRPWLRGWGASAAELDGRLPGDDLVHDRYRTTHAVTIDAPVDEVWPWLVQMGYGRGGWYTYDRLERVIGAGDFAEGGSAERIIPELQSLSMGDTVAFSLSGGATVAGLDPPRSIVLRFPMDLFSAAPASERSRAVLDWTWAFVLEPVDGGCRLIVRVRADPRPSVLALALPVLEPVHFVMERKMLRTIKRRAEAATPSIP